MPNSLLRNQLPALVSSWLKHLICRRSKDLETRLVAVIVSVKRDRESRKGTNTYHEQESSEAGGLHRSSGNLKAESGFSFHKFIAFQRM